MEIAAWLLNDPTSPKSKVYGAFAWTDPASKSPVLYTAHGQKSQVKNTNLTVNDQSQLRSEPTPRTVDAICQRFADLYDEKVAKGYQVICDPVVFDYKGLASEDDKTITCITARAIDAGHGTNSTFTGALNAALDSAVDPAARKPARRSSSVKPGPALPTVQSTTAPITMPNGTMYYPRLVSGVTDVSVVQTARNVLKQPVALVGDSGSGKSTLPIAAFGNELITYQCHGDSKPSDLIGQFIPAPPGTESDTGFVWIDGPLLTAMKEGRPILVDEITRAPSETVAVLFPALDFRRQVTVDALGGQVITAADGFWAVASYNDAGLGVNALDDALRRRFPIHITVTNDYDAAERRGVESRLLKIARNRAKVRAQQIANDEDPCWAVPVATLLDLQAMLDAGLGDEFVANALLTACPEMDRDDLATAVSPVMGVHPKELSLGPAA